LIRLLGLKREGEGEEQEKEKEAKKIGRRGGGRGGKYIGVVVLLYLDGVVMEGR